MELPNKNHLRFFLVLSPFVLRLMLLVNVRIYPNYTSQVSRTENKIESELRKDREQVYSRSLSEAYCGDHQFFTFHNDKKCTYILEKKSAATRRRLNLCKDIKIDNACKWSCGHCSDSIVDDPHFKIIKHNGDEKPCQWIGEAKYWLTRKNRRDKFCSRSKVSDACKLSCGDYDIPVNRQQRRKIGVILNSYVSNLKSYQHFGNVASWTYNFQTTLPVNQGNFADKHGIEYVPMIPQPYLLNKNCEFEPGLCAFRSPWCSHKNLSICSAQDVIDSVREGVDARTKGPITRTS